MVEVKVKCDAALVKGVILLREMASIMGNFTWVIPTMPLAQAHFRRMQAFYINQVVVTTRSPCIDSSSQAHDKSQRERERERENTRTKLS